MKPPTYHSIDSDALEGEYVRIKATAVNIIRKFFEEHGGFSENVTARLKTISERYHDKEYRFRYVVRKYFMNVTFDYRQIPWKYVAPVFMFYLHKKFSASYRRRVNALVQNVINRLVTMRQTGLSIVRHEDDITQLSKIILACSLSRYIQLFPVLGKRKNKQLHDAFISGYYLGLAYLIADHGLDDPSMDSIQRQELHETILHSLSSQAIDVNKYPAIAYLSGAAHQELPPDEFGGHYTILYYLQKIQYDDCCFQFRDFSDEEIIEKLTLLALKTHFSLYAIQMRYDELNLMDSIQEHLLYSLLVQLDDDLRDVEKDKSEGIRTFFSQPWHETAFNPHALYLQLVERMCSINPKLDWLYIDYLKHLQPREKSFDQDKINQFLEKLIGKTGREILSQRDHSEKTA